MSSQCHAFNQANLAVLTLSKIFSYNGIQDSAKGPFIATQPNSTQLDV